MSPPLILIRVRVLNTNSSAVEDIIVSTVVEAPIESPLRTGHSFIQTVVHYSVTTQTVHSSNRPVTGRIGYLIS